MEDSLLGTAWRREPRLPTFKSALNFSTTTIVSMDNDKGGVYENLFDSHPPFQIDGNFGATAGIAEMLLQSHQDFIQLLPALPVEWPTGKVEGLRAVGDFTFNIEWEQHCLRKCSFLSGSGGVCRIYSPVTSILSVKDASGKDVEIRQCTNGMYVITTERGSNYQLVLE